MYIRYGNDAFMDEFFTDPDMLAGLGMFFGVLAIVVIIFGACTLALYILRSIGLYRIAENRGMSNPGLAWIPLVGIFRAGSVADDIAEKNGSKTYFRYFILGGYLCSWVLSGISASAVAGTIVSGWRDSYGDSTFNSAAIINQSFSSLGSLVGLAVTVIIIIALNKIYKCYTPTSSTAWTVLSVIFPFLISIFLFVIRNRAPAMDWYDSQQNYYPPAQPQNWQDPTLNAGYQPTPPPYAPQDGGYYPPQAPNPPESWEVSDSKSEPPPPWNSNDNPPNGK